MPGFRVDPAHAEQTQGRRIADWEKQDEDAGENWELLKFVGMLLVALCLALPVWFGTAPSESRAYQDGYRFGYLQGSLEKDVRAMAGVRPRGNQGQARFPAGENSDFTAGAEAGYADALESRAARFR